MKLKYSPYPVFKNGKTPASLYARKKWLGEENRESWKNDFNETVEKIRGKAVQDENNILAILRNLFDLHLTVRNETDEIKDTVISLLNKSEDIFSKEDRSIVREEELGTLPFASSESCFLIPPAALFTASIFNMDTHPLSEKLYKTLIKFSAESGLDNKMLVFRHNLFRALAVNPRYSNNTETIKILKTLIKTQSNEGDWGGRIPFFQAVNAAAHMNSEDSDILFKKALPFLVKNQNKDGSWGDGRLKEWETFLAVHALRNKGINTY